MRSWPSRPLEATAAGRLAPCFARTFQRRPLPSVDVRPQSNIGLRHRTLPLQVKFFELCRSTSTVAGTHAPLPVENQRDESKETLLAIGSCSGCGAAVQTIFPNDAGYYSISRRVVGTWIKQQLRGSALLADLEDTSPAPPSYAALEEIAHLPSEPSGAEAQSEIMERGALSEDRPLLKIPVCDRCHQLLHHNMGVPIYHPSLQSIADTISESPHKYNHVYHVIDAADFPLSLVPNIHRMLATAPLRSRNRRAKHNTFYQGRKIELSFVITRSDLLAPKKEQVDSLMPYLVEVLRNALGPSSKDVRLGNVRCVSAKRGWWTPILKNDIWRRGGAGWMVGKVNVGKSNLFEVVFPKGRSSEDNSSEMDTITPRTDQYLRSDDGNYPVSTMEPISAGDIDGSEIDYLSDENILLPPPRQETAYPDMPTISSLPGTTASPIRIPFGGGKGELIDLPGLVRGGLEAFVQPEHRDGLVMKSRISPDQYVIKPGQSLLLGGLIRITPTDPNIIVLAYPFLTLKPHITSTEKAVAFQRGERQIEISMVAQEGIGEKMMSAGKFPLRWDVTKERTGPLTSRSAVGLKPQVLPFQVLSTDILIEGCGWIELVTQVRRRKMESLKSKEAVLHDEYSIYPEVEIFSPEGKFVGSRNPMGAWLLGGRIPLPSSKRTSRPRRSMKSLKGNPIRHADV